MFQGYSSILIQDNNNSEYSFTIPSHLTHKIERKISQLQYEGKGYYLLVHEVPHDTIQWIDDIFLTLHIHHGVRYIYERFLEFLIIRLIPGASYENTSGSFIRSIEVQIELLPSHSWSSYNTRRKTGLFSEAEQSKEKY